MHWLWWHLGISGTGPWYGFWSGFGSDIGQVTLAGAIFRTVNCHREGCWRLGHHYQGQVVCHRHRNLSR